MNVFGVEPDQAVVDHTEQKYKNLGMNFNLRRGTNMDTGFWSNSQDFVYASASIYYLPSDKFTILDALRSLPHS